MDATAMFDYAYECELHQPEGFSSVESRDDNNEAEAVFFLNLFSETPLLRHKFLIVPQQHLLSGQVYSSTLLSRCLMDLNVPPHAHPSIIRKITDAARAAASEDQNLNFKFIPLVGTIVGVDESSNGEEEEEEAGVLTRSLYEQLLNLAVVPPPPPAARWGHRGLKKIKIEQGSEKCVICLEEMEVGWEAAGLPCFHVFHLNCIVSWSKKSNLCPLCRSPMS